MEGARARHLAAHYPDRAIQLLREAAPRRRATRGPRVLLGNVFYRAARYETAGVEYRAAAELDPKDPLAWFNLARVRLATFQFPGAEEAMRRPARSPSERSRGSSASCPKPRSPIPSSAPSSSPPGRRGGSVPGGWSALRVATGGHAGCDRGAAAGGRPPDRAPAARARSPARAAATRPAPAARRGSATTEPVSARGQLLSRREGLDPDARREQAQRIENHLRRRGRLVAALHASGRGSRGSTRGGSGPGWRWRRPGPFLVIGALFPERLIPLTSAAPLWRAGLPMAIAATIFWLIVQLPWLRPRRAAGR